MFERITKQVKAIIDLDDESQVETKTPVIYQTIKIKLTEKTFLDEENKTIKKDIKIIGVYRLEDRLIAVSEITQEEREV